MAINKNSIYDNNLDFIFRTKYPFIHRILLRDNLFINLISLIT